MTADARAQLLAATVEDGDRIRVHDPEMSDAWIESDEWIDAEAIR